MGVLAPARRGIFSQPTAKPFPSTGLTGRLRADSIAQADNSAVATWPGLVGGDATQATSGNRPTYKISGINSKPTVQFSRASAQSLGWAGVSASTDPFSLFVVFQPPASVRRQLLCRQHSGGVPHQLRISGADRDHLPQRLLLHHPESDKPSLHGWSDHHHRFRLAVSRSRVQRADR
jgi:hypothetical protein